MSTPVPDEPTISTQRIFQGRVLGLRVDTVRLHDGKTSTREIIEHHGAVVVVPIDAEDRVLLVRQYRKAVEQALLELPAGGLNAGEEPAAAAIRELREEVGVSARSLQPLGGFYSAPGFCQEYLWLYLATDLHESPLDPDEDEFVVVEPTPFTEAIAMIERGELRDAKTVAGLLRVALMRRG